MDGICSRSSRWLPLHSIRFEADWSISWSNIHRCTGTYLGVIFLQRGTSLYWWLLSSFRWTPITTVIANSSDTNFRFRRLQVDPILITQSHKNMWSKFNNLSPVNVIMEEYCCVSCFSITFINFGFWDVCLTHHRHHLRRYLYHKFWKHLSTFYWHPSSLTCSVSIVSSTNSQPRQYFEELAPVHSLHMPGLCPRYGWRFWELVNSEGFGSYLNFSEVAWVSPKVFGYSREAMKRIKNQS